MWKPFEHPFPPADVLLVVESGAVQLQEGSATAHIVSKYKYYLCQSLERGAEVVLPPLGLPQVLRLAGHVPARHKVLDDQLVAHLVTLVLAEQQLRDAEAEESWGSV